MKIRTPQILWHECSETRKPAGINTIDCLFTESTLSATTATVVATGANSNAVHLWKFIQTTTPTAQLQQLASPSSVTVDLATSTASATTTSTPTYDRSDFSSGSASAPTPTATSSCTTCKVDFLYELSRNQGNGPIAAVRFSPNGLHLAAANSDGCVIIYSIIPNNTIYNATSNHYNYEKINSAAAAAAWFDAASESHNNSAESNLHSQVVARCNDTVTDLSWSSNSQRLLAGSMDHTVLIIELQSTPTNVSNSSSGSGAASQLENSTQQPESQKSVDATTLNSSASMSEADRSNQLHQSPQPSQQKQTTSTNNNTNSKPKWKIQYRDSSSHAHFVQGVACDPLSVYFASMAADRTIRVASRITPTTTTKIRKYASSIVDGDTREDAPTLIQEYLNTNKLDIASKLKQIKYFKTTSSLSLTNNNNTSTATVTTTNDKTEPGVVTPTTEALATPTQRTSKHHWFVDETTLESYVRRLAWTVDGAYLICPAAIDHSSTAVNVTSTESSSTTYYATIMFQRHVYDKPYKILGGLTKPSIAVRPNPTLFKIPSCKSGSATDSQQKYRNVFAVLTIDSVLVYDTYHDSPLCVIQNIHYANIVDACWCTPSTLLVCSTDGYVSIITFETDAEGKNEIGDIYTPTVTNIPLASQNNNASVISPSTHRSSPSGDTATSNVMNGKKRNVVAVTPSSGVIDGVTINALDTSMIRRKKKKS